MDNSSQAYILRYLGRIMRQRNDYRSLAYHSAFEGRFLEKKTEKYGSH